MSCNHRQTSVSFAAVIIVVVKEERGGGEQEVGMMGLVALVC